MTDHARKPPASGCETPEPSCPEPFQTAVDPGQLIRILEEKLAQGSDAAGITLSTDDARELVRALQSSKDASDRLPGIEQELVEAKQELKELKELRFLAKYADYAGKVWNDFFAASNESVPKKVTKALKYIRDKTADGGNIALGTVSSMMRPPMPAGAVECAIEAYSRRCQRFHSGAVYYPCKDTIGHQADGDLDELLAHLPDNRLPDLGKWQTIINYVKISRGPEGSKTEEISEDEDQTPRLSKLMSSKSPQFFANLVFEGVLQKSAIPFLIEYGAFAVSPDDLPPVFRSKRGRSQPPPLECRRCTQPAVSDGLSIPRFSERQEYIAAEDLANDDDQTTDQRQKSRAKDAKKHIEEAESKVSERVLRALRVSETADDDDNDEEILGGLFDAEG
ncbi:hypothetical protein FGRMN_8997 [Fusarium graminum]|nr:hypothetical protein FGRMN_8997 [Fusarium graminum]